MVGHDLWDVYLDHKDQEGFHWRAGRIKPTPIIDITSIKNLLKFHTGRGLTRKKGLLGNSLQTPRILTDGDLKLLAAALGKHAIKITPARRTSIDVEADEGEEIIREVRMYRRDPGTRARVPQSR